MHVQLIGPMCAGKSRIGRELAPLLGLPFADLDRVIESHIGPITPFFQREGEEAFRQIEAVVLGELLAGPASVIATGGGTPCEGDNLVRMKQAGTVIFLDVPLEVLMPRVERSGGDRPLLFGFKGEALQHRVQELLLPRMPIYRQAHHIIQAIGSPQAIAMRIVDLLRTDQAR